MISSKEFLIKVARNELESVNTYLAPLGIQEDVDGQLSAEELSREAAEDLELEELSDAVSKKSVTAIAAASRVAHEANRARRDINIAKASHKQLMLGIYRTMYQRKLKLERKIQEETYA